MSGPDTLEKLALALLAFKRVEANSPVVEMLDLVRGALQQQQDELERLRERVRRLERALESRP